MSPRARLAALAALLWGMCAYAYSLGWAAWAVDMGAVACAALLWLGRSRPEPLLASLGLLLAVAVRPHVGPGLFTALNLLYAAAAVYFVEGMAPDAPRSRPARSRPILAAAALVCALVAASTLRQSWRMAAPEARRAALKNAAPSFPVRDPKALSAPAARMRRDVRALAEGIGERSLYQPEAQEKAVDYIVARLREAGLTPRVLEYPLSGEFAGRRARNVEAVLPASPRPPAGAWIVGAHYDSAPGTPGADDNASGVAAVLETARRLADAPAGREVRVVFFGTEEPPSFATRNMGSLAYVRGLRAEGVRVHGLVNLEMVGYYNPNPGSQLYPPLLSRLYPDRGTFLVAVSNLRGAGLLRQTRAAWRSSLPLETLVLPSVFSTLALSDQLNFWSHGERAVMLSDTSFFRNPRYHRAEDVPDSLDYERMAALVDGLVGVLRGAESFTASNRILSRSKR